MITGDHPATAQAIAQELGIILPGRFDEIISGNELTDMSELELRRRVGKVAVYARVSPEDKLKIVKAWKENGSIVAMTGDGVNDAPALQEASIGVSMGKGGTEVARQASGMILADDHFTTIISAIGEGRAIFGNIRRTITYLLSGNLTEILVMLGAALIGWPAPLAPIHLLWINLITDGLPSLALAAEPVPKDILTQTRKPSPATFFTGHFYRDILVISAVETVIAMGLYGYALNFENALIARTYLFLFIVLSELFRSLAYRSDTKTYLQIGPWSNPYHVVAVGIPILFQLTLNHVPFLQELFKVDSLSWMEYLVVGGLSLIPVSAMEIRKLIHPKQG